jgi:hypothetical protein
MKPDTVLISITCADDSVAVMAFVTTDYTSKGIPRWSRPAADAEVEKEIARAATTFDSSKLPIKGWRFIAREEIPADRTFRDALVDDGVKLKHDMPRAREIHRAHLREARALALAGLDVEYQRADETGDKDKKAQVVALKQQLRDITQHPGIEAAQTTDELKAVWHEALKG